MAYSEIEPWGDQRTDVWMAVLCALLANGFTSINMSLAGIHGDKKARARAKRWKPHDVERFMIFQEGEKPKRKKTWEDQLHAVKQMVTAMGGRDLREPKESVILDAQGRPFLYGPDIEEELVAHRKKRSKVK